MAPARENEPGAKGNSGITLDLASVVAKLRAVRERWRTSQQRPREMGGRELPSREALSQIISGLRGALFPMRLGPPDLRQEGEDYYVGHTLDTALAALLQQVRLELKFHARQAGATGATSATNAASATSATSATSAANTASPFETAVTGAGEIAGGGSSVNSNDIESRVVQIVREFGAALPRIRELLDSDVLAAFHGDPAAGSVDEVLLCYPGIQAMIHHRMAHQLYTLGVPLLARVIAELAHGETGIDIHPGARIGAGFFIDHGTGVVIGETAEIGRNVRLYQAVTLGAKRFDADADGHLHKGGARHPIVEDEVVIYAGATLLGRVTIGRGSVIGGNVWLTHSVPPGSHVSQARARDDARDGREPGRP